MPKILRLEASKHVKGRVLVFFQDADLIKLTEDEVLLHRLYAGKELSPSAYKELTEAGKLSAAKYAAAQVAGRRLLSRGELLGKLREKGQDPVYSERAADWLEELGVLDEARYASAVVRHYAAKGYGQRRIQDEFYRRKISRDYWAEALEELEAPDDTLDRLLRQKLRGADPSDPKTLRRVQGFLLRRGYGWEDIRAALERFGCD